jgi:hypothetical protein
MCSPGCCGSPSDRLARLLCCGREQAGSAGASRPAPRMARRPRLTPRPRAIGVRISRIPVRARPVTLFSLWSGGRPARGVPSTRRAHATSLCPAEDHGAGCLPGPRVRRSPTDADADADAGARGRPPNGSLRGSPAAFVGAWTRWMAHPDAGTLRRGAVRRRHDRRAQAGRVVCSRVRLHLLPGLARVPDVAPEGFGCTRARGGLVDPGPEVA